MEVSTLLALAVAGGLGACVRFVAVEGWPWRRAETTRPRRLATEWRLMIVNVIASLIAGFAAGLLPLPTVASIVVISGFCGGMSSWSSVMLDAANALSARKVGKLAIIVLVQMMWGVLAALVGLTAGQFLGELMGLGFPVLPF